EAALEASGLLDAFVSTEGLVLHPKTHDVLWRADAAAVPEGSKSLADVLIPADETVASLLRTIGLDEPAARDGQPHPYVTLDGRWSLPPLQGSWAKAAPEFLGAPTRRATRARRLADVERRLSDQRVVLEAASRGLAEARHVGEAVGRWIDRLPDDGPVRSEAAKAGATGHGLERARMHHDEDRRLAEQARSVAAVARTELEHRAAADTLPRTVDDLDVAIASASELAGGLRRWIHDWHELEAVLGEAIEARERKAARGVAAAAADDRASALEGELEREQVGLKTLEEAVGASVEQVLRAIEAASRHKDEAADAEPAARRRVTELAGTRGEAIGRHGESGRIVEEAAECLDRAIGRLTGALGLPGVAAAALGADFAARHLSERPEPSSQVELARQVIERLGEFTPVSDSTILNRLHVLGDGLSGGYDVVDDEEDGVKFVLVADDAGRQALPAVSARVSAEAAAARDRLAAGERETIERFLLGELGEEVRERLLEAHDLVRSANQALGAVHSSHGKGARLDWSVDEEAAPGARAAARLLVMSPRSEQEDAELRDLLLDLIRGERERDPALGYGEHLRAALDYRSWHRFAVQVTDEARWPGPRVLSPRLGLSQGEQRVLSYLALFAAASAHFKGLGSSCPRLLLLDDAFAKVDEPTHGRLLELLISLDLDFMITSERMWGCFPQVTSLEIYEVLRDPSATGVALVHFHWDGHERHLVGI
ncbi:MAG: SbcC/MukB-like Walker B domain-containing protein, partial [Acidimicrobiales bacterium]